MFTPYAGTVTHTYAVTESNRKAVSKFLFSQNQEVNDVALWVSSYIGGVYVEKINLTVNRLGQRTIIAIVKNDGSDEMVIIGINQKMMGKLSTAKRKIYNITKLLAECNRHWSSDIPYNAKEIEQGVCRFVAALAV